MSSSSSVQPPNRGAHGIRNRATGVGYSQPQPIPSIASSPESPKIHNESLILLARQVAQLDYFVLDLCIAAFKQMAEQDTNIWAGLEDVDFQQELITAQLTQRQFAAVEGGRRTYGSKYLEDEAMLLFWSRASNVLLSLYRSDRSENNANHEVALRNARPLLDGIDALPELLIEVASAGLLSVDIRKTIRDRYLKLEDIWKGMKGPLSDEGVVFSSWQDISKQLVANTTESNPERSFANLTPSRTIATTLWVLFCTTTLSSVPISYFAYYYSSHEPGTVNSSDFWFLLQGCITQLFGIWTMALSLKDTGMGLVSRTLPLIIATLATIGAPIVHVFAPAEWSDFMAWVGAAVQAFFALQIAIYSR